MQIRTENLQTSIFSPLRAGCRGAPELVLSLPKACPERRPRSDRSRRDPSLLGTGITADLMRRQALAQKFPQPRAAKPLISAPLLPRAPFSTFCRKLPRSGAQWRKVSWVTAANGSGSLISSPWPLISDPCFFDCATVLLATPCPAITYRQNCRAAQKLCNCARPRAAGIATAPEACSVEWAQPAAPCSARCRARQVELPESQARCSPRLARLPED